MNKSTVINILLWVSSVASLALAGLCAVFALNTENTFSKIIIFIVSVLFVALSVMVGYLAYSDTFKVYAGGEGSKKKPLNYFLNANGKRRGIALEDLTFEIIDKRMSDFVVNAFGSPVALWKNQVFSADEDVFGKECVFKVLLAYKMLSDLQIHHSKKAWRMFYELPDADFADIQECLVENGDDELARTLNSYRLAGEASVGEAVAFLDENASYIQRRMINYVTRKIELFNM